MFSPYNTSVFVASTLGSVKEQLRHMSLVLYSPSVMMNNGMSPDRKL